MKNGLESSGYGYFCVIFLPAQKIKLLIPFVDYATFDTIVSCKIHSDSLFRVKWNGFWLLVAWLMHSKTSKECGHFAFSALKIVCVFNLNQNSIIFMWISHPSHTHTHTQTIINDDDDCEWMSEREMLLVQKLPGQRAQRQMNIYYVWNGSYLSCLFIFPYSLSRSSAQPSPAQFQSGHGARALAF